MALTWLDALLFGYRLIVGPSNNELPTRPTVKFAGAGVNSITDDAENNRTVVTINAGAGAVPTSRKIIAGSGLGSDPVAPADLTADIELFVDVINDTQHGQRGGGDLHELATTGVDGFMSADDKAKLDGIEVGSNVGIISVVQGQGVEIDITDAANPVVSAPRLDDVSGGIASTGAVRLGSTEAIKSLSDSGDASLVSLNGSNTEVLGDNSIVSGHEVRAKSGGIWKWIVSSAEILRMSFDGLILFGETVAGGIGQTKRTGNGANAGSTLQVSAQDGQDVASGTNNDGGKLALSSGAVGTGGTSGTHGAVELQVGGTTQLTVAGDGTAATFATDKVVGKVFTAGFYDSGDATGTVDLEFAKSQNLYVDSLVDNVTFTFSGVQAGARYHVIARQNASVAKTTTWPATVAFASGQSAIGTALDKYTAWLFAVLPSGRLVCVHREADITIP